MGIRKRATHSAALYNPSILAVIVTLYRRRDPTRAGEARLRDEAAEHSKGRERSARSVPDREDPVLRRRRQAAVPVDPPCHQFVPLMPLASARQPSAIEPVSSARDPVPSEPHRRSRTEDFRARGRRSIGSRAAIVDIASRDDRTSTLAFRRKSTGRQFRKAHFSTRHLYLTDASQLTFGIFSAGVETSCFTYKFDRKDPQWKDRRLHSAGTQPSSSDASELRGASSAPHNGLRRANSPK